MGVMDKFFAAMKLSDDDYDYDDDEFLDDEDLDEYEEERPRKKLFKKFDLNDDDIDDDIDYKESTSELNKKSVRQPKVTKQPRKSSSKITPMRTTKKQGGNMEVVVVKPSSMEDTREIADALLEQCTVVLNLEGIDVEVAQRIIDFTSGACYSINGKLQKISSYIFILTPSTVDISGDYQDILNSAFDLPSIRTEF